MKNLSLNDKEYLNKLEVFNAIRKCSLPSAPCTSFTQLLFALIMLLEL